MPELWHSTINLRKHSKERGYFMRYMYSCDKCGKLFESYDECSVHENAHRSLTISPTEYQIAKFSEYEPNSVVPSVIYAGFYEYVENQADEPVLFKYKLVCQSQTMSDKYQEVLEAEQAQAKKEEEERKIKLAGMLKEIPENKRDYWNVSDIYKKRYGHYFGAE
jgi:hypothetical protein